MTYQVLARKWRPKTFRELVGQQHVVKALTNSITNDKLHHAYLFTGTRGVGKTTIARIFAKALNCEQGPTSMPCLNCATCKAIADGSYADLIEVDAASRTRVEDTKELLDNVQYMPTQGRYKIYLIDEVHMLSGHSFNALLKTLEEPPAHVIFMLATTDPQKIPITVLSRCLQFVLKPLSADDIEKYLSLVLQGECVEAEQKALMLLGKAAGGSLRDSLSLLDQAIAYSQGCIRYQDILSMLSTVDDICIYQLLAAIAQDDSAAVLALCQTMSSDGVDFLQVLERFLEVIHEIATLQCINIRQSMDTSKTLIKFADHFSKEDIQLFYEICLNGRLALASMPLAKIGFEMTMLRLMSFKLTKPELLKVENLKAVQENALTTDKPKLEKTPSSAIQVLPLSIKEDEFPAGMQNFAEGGTMLEAKPASLSEVNSILDISELDDSGLEQDNPVDGESFSSFSKNEFRSLSEKEILTPIISHELQNSASKTLQMIDDASKVSPAGLVVSKKYSINSSVNHIDLPWFNLVELLPLAGMAKTVIMHCNLIEKTDGLVRLGIEDNYQAMLTSTAKQSIEAALRAYWQCDFKVLFEVLTGRQEETPAMIKARTHDENLKQAKAALTEDTCFNEIISRFDGQVDLSTAKLTE